MRSGILALSLATVIPAGVFGQAPADPQKLFEAGGYQQAIDAIAQREPTPDLTYLAGMSHLRLGHADAARAEFGKLVVEGEPTPWSLVGESASAFAGGDHGLALDKANQAAQMAPDQFAVQYQLGLVQNQMEQWEPSAASFERASALNPDFAYAHYYAGLAYSKIKRVDLMAKHFEYFLKLAPEAPERGAVQSIMRTVRGR